MKPRVREALVVWLGSIAAIAVLVHGVARLHPYLWANRGGLAAIVFLLVPGEVLRRRGGDLRDYGVRFDRLGRDVLLGLGVCAAVFPIFLAGYWGFTRLVPLLPAWITPYRTPPELHWRLPPGMVELVLGHVLAVALPEEIYYRGYLQGRLAEDWPPRARILGAPFGRAALVATVLFALGHLAFQPALWRLGPFFPGLLFAWLRERTGTVVPGIVVHGASNVFMKVLEASFYGLS